MKTRSQQEVGASCGAEGQAVAKVSQQEILDAFAPEKLHWGNFDWTVIVWMSLMHLGCLAAPFYFTWGAFAAFLLFYFLTASVGVCLAYHRFLAHRSFKLARPVQFLVNLCGVLSVEGSPLRWAATHRLHHARSDQPGDPHSPRDGTLWSHILWLFLDRSRRIDDALYRRFVPDLLNDKMLVMFDRTFLLWSILLAGAFYLIGGLPMVIWGMCVRMVFAYHCTWFVNSATHLWGYRNYNTTDDAKNLWWVAILAFGEGWHNNHHAFPALARAGHRWWEIDVTFWVIRSFQLLGLAWEVRDEIPARKAVVPLPDDSPSAILNLETISVPAAEVKPIPA